MQLEINYLCITKHSGEFTNKCCICLDNKLSCHVYQVPNLGRYGGLDVTSFHVLKVLYPVVNNNIND